MRFLLVVGILYGVFFNSIAQRVVVVDDVTNEFVFGGDYLHIFEDSEKKWTIKEVSDPAFQNRFTINQSGYPYNENLKSAYWIKFRVKSVASKNTRFLLESYAPHTNIWEVYMPDGVGGYNVKVSGLNKRLYEREYVNKNLILDLPMDSGQVCTFYVRVESDNHSSFDYRIKKINYFFFYSVNEYYFLGVYYGIMIIMAVYNLLMYFSLKEKVYIYYVFYVLAGILTSLSDDSIGNQYVWVNYPSINTIIGSHIAPLFLLITFILYSRSFLHLRENYKFYDNIVLLLTLVYLLIFVFRLFFPNQISYMRGLYVVPFVAMYLIAIKIYSNGYKPAKYIIIGFGFILISIIIIKLRSNGSIEGNLFTVYSFNYGLVLEVLILSFALAERVKYSEKQKEEALKEKNKAQQNEIIQYQENEKLKDKVNRELEKKVEERTIELNTKNKQLEDTNKQLQEMTERANQMSMKLDADNWNLQKKVLESIRDRMVGQEVSYEEFNKLFPNETACYRYLSELKWDKGYECYKCKHLESVDMDDKLFSKKCQKCGYVESVTAHTLFHALKFPINKAFYVLYIMIYQQDRLTLDALSELLALRRNTCWKFKQKIMASVEVFEKKYKRKNTEAGKSWEMIIFVDQKRRKQ